MEFLIYIGILLIVALFAIGIICLTRKYDITRQELEFVTIVLQLVEHVSKQFKFEYQHHVSRVMGYVVQAAQLAERLINIDGEDCEQVKIIIFDKAKEICLNEGLEIDAELEAMLDSAVTFLIENYYNDINIM